MSFEVFIGIAIAALLCPLVTKVSRLALGIVISLLLWAVILRVIYLLLW